jgi:hypothetical protein
MIIFLRGYIDFKTISLFQFIFLVYCVNQLNLIESFLVCDIRYVRSIWSNHCWTWINDSIAIWHSEIRNLLTKSITNIFHSYIHNSQLLLIFLWIIFCYHFGFHHLYIYRIYSDCTINTLKSRSFYVNPRDRMIKLQIPRKVVKWNWFVVSKLCFFLDIVC